MTGVQTCALPIYLILQKKHIRWLNNGVNDEGEEFKWDRMIKGGIIELLDAEEEETVMISMTPEDLENSRLQRAGGGLQVNDGEFDPAARLKAGTHAHTWTHCEIHPSMILGICASIIPFPDHNQVSYIILKMIISFIIFLSHRVTPTNLLWVSKLWVST